MSEEVKPKTEARVGARLSAQLNLGDYNLVKMEVWVEDRVRDDLDEGKTSRAVDRVRSLVDDKLNAWAEGFKDG